ncbi:DUF29 domain-containing protein [Gloeomargarita sp.]
MSMTPSAYAQELSALYETDFNLWLEQTIQLLKTQQFQYLDLAHLIEELEGLGKRDKRELQSRLTTLFEHALKRKYVASPYDYRGWVSTLKRTQIEMKRLLNNSPSLRHYCLVIWDECYRDALAIVTIEYDADFPQVCPFPADLDRLLREPFWE